MCPGQGAHRPGKPAFGLTSLRPEQQPTLSQTLKQTGCVFAQIFTCASSYYPVHSKTQRSAGVQKIKHPAGRHEVDVYLCWDKDKNTGRDKLTNIAFLDNGVGTSPA